MLHPPGSPDLNPVITNGTHASKGSKLAADMAEDSQYDSGIQPPNRLEQMLQDYQSKGVSQYAQMVQHISANKRRDQHLAQDLPQDVYSEADHVPDTKTDSAVYS